MEEVLRYLVNSVTGGECEITQTEENGKTIVTVLVAPDDLGKVIGKNGKIASSIRTIAKYIGKKSNKCIIKFGERVEA